MNTSSWPSVPNHDLALYSAPRAPQEFEVCSRCQTLNNNLQNLRTQVQNATSWDTKFIGLLTQFKFFLNQIQAHCKTCINNYKRTHSMIGTFDKNRQLNPITQFTQQKNVKWWNDEYKRYETLEQTAKEVADWLEKIVKDDSFNHKCKATKFEDCKKFVLDIIGTRRFHSR